MNEQYLIECKIQEKAQTLLDKGIKKVYLIHSDGSKEKRGIFKSTIGRLCVYSKGSRRRGYPILDVENLKDIQEIKEKPESEKWEKSIDKVISLLEKSGLWKELLEKFKIAKSIGWEKLQDAYKIYEEKYKEDYYENQKEIILRIKKIDERLIRKSEDKEFYDTDILWNMVFPLKIKKMNFGKYQNNLILKKIKDAIQKKAKYSSGRIQVNYDVSFEYDGDNKAWYSEEYRNCGNGHYYLALSDEHALFYEDD